MQIFHSSLDLIDGIEVESHVLYLVGVLESRMVKLDHESGYQIYCFFEVI